MFFGYFDLLSMDKFWLICSTWGLVFWNKLVVNYWDVYRYLYCIIDAISMLYFLRFTAIFRGKNYTIFLYSADLINRHPGAIFQQKMTWIQVGKRISYCMKVAEILQMFFSGFCPRTSYMFLLAIGATPTMRPTQRIDVVFGGISCHPVGWKCLQVLCTPRKTNIAMGNPPSEDVSPITNGGFPLLCSFTGG